MTRTSQNVISKKTECNIVQQSSIDTTDAFKACLRTDADKKFYKDIPKTFFIRPAARMKSLFLKAESYAIQTGTESLNALLDDKCDSDASVSSNDSGLPSVCTSYVRCDSNGPKTSDKLPSVDQLSQFVRCFKNCLPFANHLLIVQDHSSKNNCWCPMCVATIDWTKRQCCGFDHLIKNCDMKGRYSQPTTYNHLKQEKKCTFHQTAFSYLKSLMYEIKQQTKIHPKLELHYVANPKPDAHYTKPVYSRESPHVKKHNADDRNSGIVPSDKIEQSSSNKNSCSGAVSDHPNPSS